MKFEVLGNTSSAWLLALAVALAINAIVALAVLVTRRRLQQLAKSSVTAWDDAIVAVINRTRQPLIFLATIYVGSHWLILPAGVDKMLLHLAKIACFLQLGIWCTTLLAFLIARTQTVAVQSADIAATTSLAALAFIGRVLIWSVISLLLLSNLGVDVTTVLAGLGVGGIAVALALQSILGDLFASLSIVLDKPFVIGDFVIVDDFLGTIEYVGIKTTRMRSLSGEQVIFSNSDLLRSRLRNYKRMSERRIVFEFGLLYRTPVEVLKHIPAKIQQIIEAQSLTRFERAHFRNFAASSLDFEVVYWMLDPDYNKYMDTQQAINLALMQAFAAEGVEFAYPSRTLYFDAATATNHKLDTLANLQPKTNQPHHKDRHVQHAGQPGDMTGETAKPVTHSFR